MRGKEFLLATMVAFTACTPTRQEPLRPTVPIMGTPRTADAGATPFPTLGPKSPPSVTETAVPITSLDQWLQLPHSEKIRRIEKNQAPTLRNFSLLDELAIATVASWCANTQCVKQEVTVGFLSAANFVRQTELDLGRILSPAERARAETQQAARLSKDKTRLLLNAEVIRKLIDAFPQLRPEAFQFLKNNGINIDAAVVKTIILQQLLIKGISKEIYQIPRPLTQLKFETGQTVIAEEIEGLVLHATADGNAISSVGMSNILSVILTEVLCKKDGTAYVPIPPYDKAADILKTLLKSTAITEEDLFDIFRGNQSVEKLLHALGYLKNGEADVALGTQAFTILSLQADGTIPTSVEAQRLLESLYGKKIFGGNPPTT